MIKIENLSKVYPDGTNALKVIENSKALNDSFLEDLFF